MKKEDIARCTAIILASEPWKTLKFSKKEARASLLDGVKNGEAIVAKINKEVVGFIVFYPKGAFPLGGYIKLLGVHKNFRGVGIGKALMKLAEKVIFKRSKNSFLLVSSFNKRAQKFYYSLGYKKIGEIPDAIIKGHSELIMRKTLGPVKKDV
ncbi:MAG: GNAT family N-acetyltransferase [Thermoproteota archaeon]